MDPTFDNQKNEEDEIMISQLTVDENQEIDITINIQGKSLIPNTADYKINEITFKYDPKDEADEEESVFGTFWNYIIHLFENI